MTTGQPSERDLLCPVCLTSLRWPDLDRWRYDSASLGYVRLEIPGGLGPEQLRRAERGAVVRCPGPPGGAGQAAGHYLPIGYGRYGQPVVLGLIGAAGSGKTHLLAAMIGEIDRGGLSTFGIACRPLDQAWHRDFVDGHVQPLLREHRVIESTGHGRTHFADAFLVGSPGQERPVVIFDVAGAELGLDLTSRDGSKPFLDVADGLVFVVDPASLDQAGATGDETFSTVLDVLRESGRLERASAAIVLGKADLVRFDDPVTRWLRTPVTGADPDQMRQESSDVFAYLDARRVLPLTRPYTECARATLHVATATGGQDLGKDFYPRGVSPCRVLAPLVALLAMTGVITGDRAARIGVKG